MILLNGLPRQGSPKNDICLDLSLNIMSFIYMQSIKCYQVETRERLFKVYFLPNYKVFKRRSWLLLSCLAQWIKANSNVKLIEYRWKQSREWKEERFLHVEKLFEIWILVKLQIISKHHFSQFFLFCTPFIQKSATWNLIKMISGIVMHFLDEFKANRRKEKDVNIFLSF